MTRGRREDDRFFYEHIVLNVESGVFSLISFNCRVFFFFCFFLSVSDLIGHSQCVKNDARFVDSARTLDGKRIVSIRRPVFRHGKISGNPFSRRTFVLDDRTRRIKWSNVASQTDVLSGTIRLWTLYVQREGRCILFSNVCPDCGDPSLPGRISIRRSNGQPVFTRYEGSGERCTKSLWIIVSILSCRVYLRFETIQAILKEVSIL